MCVNVSEIWTSALFVALARAADVGVRVADLTLVGQAVGVSGAFADDLGHGFAIGVHAHFKTGWKWKDY